MNFNVSATLIKFTIFKPELLRFSIEALKGQWQQTKAANHVS